MQSCIYEGYVAHHRLGAVTHQFRYRLSMAYLDLAELPALVRPRGLISDRKFSWASFRAEDHLRHHAGPLDEAARDLVEERTGARPQGPIRLLTQLRYMGYYFSPLNLFFCFDSHGREVEAIIAEVNNTPWREQHYYVLWEGNRRRSGESLSFAHRKDFHVSPFMDMDAEYLWKLSVPGSSLRVNIRSSSGGCRRFNACMNLSRRPLTRWQRTRTTLRYPVMTAQIAAAIYYQALRLYLKKCQFYSHPNKRPPQTDVQAPAPHPVDR